MTRAPVRLSREMKLLLMLLLMVGLIGLWYVWTNNRTAGEIAQQTGPTATTTPGGAGTTGTGGTGTSGTATDGAGTASTNPDAVTVTTPGSPGSGTTETGTSTDGQPLTVQPDGQVDVEVIPPFPTGEGTTTPAPTVPEEPVVPGGINPDGVIASAPVRNPFRPLSLDATGEGAPSATPASSVNAGSSSDGGGTGSSSAGPVTAAAPSSTPDSIDSLGNNGGALGLSPIPGSDGSVSVDSGSVNGGALPVPVIPGGDGSAGVDATPIVVPNPAQDSGAQTPGAAPVVTPVPDTGAGTVTLSPPRPAPAPIAGVSVPSVNRLPDVVASAPAGAEPTGAGSTGTGSTGTGSTGTGSTGTGQTGQNATALPTPSTPQVITELGRGDVAPGTGTAETPTPLSALDRFVQGQELVFNAVVLGPVNTAIFRGKSGYVVVSAGQTLPDSKVTVGAITPTSATLSLDNDSTILELDKR